MRAPACFFLVSILAVAPVRAVDPWPAEPAEEAGNLTAVEGPEPNDFAVDLSGAFWNTTSKRLWICRDGGLEGSKFWALVPGTGGTFEVEYRDGLRGEWTDFGNVEDITQVDLDTDIVYLIIEGEERIKSYDVSSFGSAVPVRDWDISAYLPLMGGRGAEGIAFVPDRFLVAAGFVDAGGSPYTSARGLGGLMLVGHQNGGGIYAFDLDPTDDTFTFVGEYMTAYEETAALHFDRSNGRLYVWHDSTWDTWEVGDLSSTAIAGSSARRFRSIRTFDGPHHQNNEGLALTSTDDCVDGFRSAFLATDGGGPDSLTWFKRYAEGCQTLTVGKNEATGTVELSWSGGIGPYTMLRAEDPTLIEGRTRLADEASITGLADPVLNDGKTYFYVVP